jgi:glycosyltransferase involved in cell wall biosynthesis
VCPIVAGFDIVLQPRIAAHAMPQAILAYMAARRAIVAPDQPNIREILRDGDTALLFDPGRAGAMWAAVARLAANASLRARLGAAARSELGRRNYPWRGKAGRIANWATADCATRFDPLAVPAAMS